jgi:DNA repair exonuclease SbcCD ATPase subunit
MPLSLGKLEKMLIDNRFIINAFYMINQKCEYVKVFSINYGETLILRIPREYDFSIREQEMINRGNDVFHLTNVELLDDNEIKNKVEKFKNYPNEKELEEKYIPIEKSSEINPEIEDLEEELEKNYKKRIQLRDLEKSQILEIKDCQRQMKRLQHVVQNLKYNICIVEDFYFLVGDKCYICKTQKTEEKRFLFILVDIEIFHQSLKTIIEDVISIKKGIYKILDKNSEINSTNLFLILEKFEDIENVLENVVKKKSDIHLHIEKYRETLENLIDEEKETIEEISELEEKRTDFFSDSQYVHKKSKLESKLLSLQNLKQRLLKNLNDAFQTCDNIYLKTDKCEFDAAVLLDSVHKDIDTLKDF